MAWDNQAKIQPTNRRQVDGTRLVDKIGSDRHQSAWRTDFTNCETADERRFDACEDVIEPLIANVGEDVMEATQAGDDIQTGTHTTSEVARYQTEDVEQTNETAQRLTGE
jgi:hypothetical protein